MDTKKVADVLIRIAEVLLLLGIASIVFSLVMEAIRDYRQFLYKVGGVAVLGLLVGLGYLLEPSTQPAYLVDQVGGNVEVVRWAGALLRTTYILGSLTVLAVVGSEVYRLIR